MNPTLLAVFIATLTSLIFCLAAAAVHIRRLYARLDDVTLCLDVHRDAIKADARAVVELAVAMNQMNENHAALTNVIAHAARNGAFGEGYALPPGRKADA